MKSSDQSSTEFASVDLDETIPSYRNTLPFNGSSTTDSSLLVVQDNLARRSFTSNTMFNRSSTDRRISIPDMSKLSATSAAAMAVVGPTSDKLKQWSRWRYKCTKQWIYEKIGKTTRTVNVELDMNIEQLREMKRRYETILALARSYANHFANLMSTQRGLSEHFFELKQRSHVLCDEFGQNAEIQRILVHHGEILLTALNCFISTLQTLCTKTIEDTMITIRCYEISRLEFDACRTELEILSPGVTLNSKQEEFEKCREKYEKFKADVIVKLQLLEENQVHVMKNQLLLFHNAIAAYFSGNKDALDATMKQFSLKVLTTDHRNSFLE